MKEKLPTIIVILLIIILAITFIMKGPIQPPKEQYTFEDVFNAIKELDVKYNTDLRQETLKGAVLGRGSILGYKADLEALRIKMENNTIEDHQEYVTNFFDAREAMLASEDYFQQALEYKEKGVFNAPEDCNNLIVLEEATLLYNMSWRAGVNAMRYLDLTLRLHEARPLVGIAETKPAFYDKIFQDLSERIRLNDQAIRRLCPEYLANKASETF